MDDKADTFYRNRMRNVFIYKQKHEYQFVPSIYVNYIKHFHLRNEL